MPQKKKKTTRKTKRNQNKKNIINNECFMFSMLLATISILAVTLNDYTFKIGVLNITFSVFVFPIILFISNYITKKYGFKAALQAIFISSLTIVAFIILIKDLVNQPISFLELCGQFISYFIGLFINLCIYYYNLINFKENIFLIYFNYIFSIIMYHLVYLLFLYNMLATEYFWNQYFVSLIIQGLMIIGLVWLDSKIERGISKD